MGLSPSAELVWGIPVLAFDDECEPTQWWDEKNDDWRTFPGTELYIEGYGHYEDPDGPRGILTSKALPHFSGDAWDPTLIGKWEFNVEDYAPDAVESFLDDVIDSGLERHLGGQGWWLAASYG